MKKWKALMALLLCAVCLLANSLPTFAATETDIWIQNETGVAEPPEVASAAAILIEAKTGTVLYAKDADTAYYPASITKVMTALLTVENCTMDETVVFSYRATHELESNASNIGRDTNEELVVKDCLYALLLASANEVAQALGEHISGSLEDFGVLMTERAKELGCTSTNFTNPSGLHNDEHYTTARDMAKIMAAAVTNPDFMEVDSTRSYTIPATNIHADPTPVATKHPLLYGETRYEYAVAGKTGYTSMAGNTLVTYAEKDGMGLICVILKSDIGKRATDSRQLFDYGFENFSLYQLQDIYGGQTAETLISDGLLGEDVLNVDLDSEAWAVLPKTISADQLKAQAEWQDNDTGGTAGTLSFYYRELLTGQMNFTLERIPPETAAEADSKTEVPESGSEAAELAVQTLSLSPEHWLLIGGGVLVLLAAGLLAIRISDHRKRREARNDKISRKNE